MSLQWMMFKSPASVNNSGGNSNELGKTLTSRLVQSSRGINFRSGHGPDPVRALFIVELSSGTASSTAPMYEVVLMADSNGHGHSGCR